MIFLTSLQRLFMPLFLSFVKFFVFFHFLLTCFNLFPFLWYYCTCLGNWNTLQLFLVFRISPQNRLYDVFFDGTSGFGVFKGFYLKTLHTLSVFWMKLSLSSFTPVNSQRVLRNFCMFVIFYLWKNQLTDINELDISFFMISLKVMKNLTGSRWSSEKINYFSSSKMAGTPMVYSSSVLNLLA